MNSTFLKTQVIPKSKKCIIIEGNYILLGPATGLLYELGMNIGIMNCHSNLLCKLNSMKFVYIYGPPATGKLTVANELSNVTDLKVFHNHLTIDLIKPFFEFGPKSFFELSTDLRLKIFEAASKENIPGLIFSSCYSFPEDNGMVRKIIRKIEKYGGKIFFVHLFADIEELKKRVTEPSRKDYGKVKTEDGLQNCLSKWNMFTPIPFVESLQIDNTNLTSKEVAARIKDYYKL